MIKKSMSSSTIKDYISSTIQVLHRELEHKRVEIQSCKHENRLLQELLNETIEKLEQITKENTQLANENHELLQENKKLTKKERYAENEFKRLGVIDERDRLQRRLDIHLAHGCKL